MKKYGKWFVAAFVIFYLLSQPEAAARSVHRILGALESAGGSVATFLEKVSE